MTFALVAMENTGAERVALVPLYYTHAERPALRSAADAAGRLATRLPTLDRTEFVVDHEDPEPFFPDSAGEGDPSWYTVRGMSTRLAGEVSGRRIDRDVRRYTASTVGLTTVARTRASVGYQRVSSLESCMDPVASLRVRRPPRLYR